MARNSDKVIPYRRPFHWNIGTVIFLVVLIYLVIRVAASFHREHVQIYEVGEVSSVVQDTTYTGLILRSEEVQNAPADGYLNISIQDGERAAAGETVCTIDETGDTAAKLVSEQAEGVTLTDSQLLALRKKLTGFSATYHSSSFSSIYDLKTSLQNQLLGYYEAGGTSQSSLTDSTGLTSVKSASSGVIEYYTDGMEDLTEDQLTADIVNEEGYSRTMLSSGEKVQAGNPVCKTITDETWYVYLPLTSEDQSALSEQESVTLLFHDANIETETAFSLYTASDGTILGRCELDNYMVELADKRYVSVTVEKSNISSLNISGLKIPKSAVVSQEFYVIPVSYAAKGGNTDSIGFYKQTDTGAVFIQPAICAKTDDYYFVSMDEVSEGTVLLMPSSDQKAATGEETSGVAATTATETSASETTGSDASSAAETTESDASSAAETTGADASSAADESGESGADGTAQSSAETISGDSLDPAGTTYTIRETGTLSGVYTCNRGYATFRRIETLDEDEDYLIIAEDTDYGVDIYDRIVLNGSLVEEGQMVY